jgi:predicted nucleic acid-binding protein
VIIVDASAWVTAAFDENRAGDTCRAYLRSDKTWMAPSHMPTEALRTVRRFEVAGAIDQAVAQAVVNEIAAAAISYVGPEPALLLAQWQLRHNLSAYDAPYVVLGRRLGAPLITLDTRLAQAATALGVEVQLVQRD